MTRPILGPLESKVAKLLAERRGVSVDTLIANLLREEAAIELVGLRSLLSGGAAQVDPPERLPAVEVQAA